MYFDQLLGAACTWKLVKILYLSSFQLFFFILNVFQWFITWNKKKYLKLKMFKTKKKGWKWLKKSILTVFGCAHYRKAAWNTQHPCFNNTHCVTVLTTSVIQFVMCHFELEKYIAANFFLCFLLYCYWKMSSNCSLKRLAC